MMVEEGTSDGSGVETTVSLGKNGEQAKRSTKTRAQLSMADKHEICKMHKESPLLSHEEILSQFLLKRNLRIGRSTVTKILKEKDRWLAVDYAGMADNGQRKRARKPPFQGVEAALYAWYSQKQSGNRGVPDAQLKDRAKQLAREAGFVNFKSSDGWLANFKKRHSIKHVHATHQPHLENTEQHEPNRATNLLQKIIDELGFLPEDTFNFGETGLCFRAQPLKNLEAVPLRMKKLQKDRITVGLCFNATGDEKLKLLVVYKSRAPPCFDRWDPESLVHYHSNAHARMTNAVFVDWVRKVNREMASKRRRILILLDSAPSHDIPGHQKVTIHTYKTIQLSSVTLLFCPRRSAVTFQPLDAGCIEAFKMHYRKHLLTRSLDDLEGGGSGYSSSRSMTSVKDAILWAVLAWEEVGQQTIQQSWSKVNIRTVVWNGELNACSERDHAKMHADAECELGNLIASLKLGDIALSPSSYLMLPGEDETESSYTDEELLQLVHDAEAGSTNADNNHLDLSDGPDDSDDRLPPSIPLDDARRMFRGASQFMIANPQMFSSEDLLALQRWCYKVSRATLVERERLQQSRIMSYFLE